MDAQIVYVVILNWNGWNDTIACLESVLASKGVNFRLIVCDNASTDGSMAHIIAWATEKIPQGFVQMTRDEVDCRRDLPAEVRLVLIQNGDNLGFAGGNNIGVRLAMKDSACQFVWILNNDTTVPEDALANAVRRMKQDSRLGICGSTLIYHDTRNVVQAWGGASYSRLTGKSAHIGAFSTPESVPADPTATESAMDYVVGAAMLVSRQFIEQIGYMREDYFLYYEEMDWAVRGAGKFRLGYAPDSIVYHKEGASIGTAASGGSALSSYYLFRNRLRITYRYYRIYLPTVCFSLMLDIARFVLKGRYSNARAALRGALQYGSPK